MEHLRSFASYIVAGGIATAAHYVVTIVAVEVFGIRALLASMIGFTAGALTKYVLNYSVAFRSRARHHVAVPRFVLVLAGMFAANAGVFWLLHDLAGLHYLIAQAGATVVLIPVGYLLNRDWVFG